MSNFWEMSSRDEVQTSSLPADWMHIFGPEVTLEATHGKVIK